MTKPTKIEKRRAMWRAARPEVQRLVRKFDHGAIAHCLKALADKKALARRITELRKEAASLERKL